MDHRKTTTTLLLLLAGVVVALATPELTTTSAAVAPPRDAFLLAVRVVVGVAIVGIVMAMFRTSRDNAESAERSRDNWH